MSSLTGRLSTTSQLRPEGAPSERRATSAWRRAISPAVQTVPFGT
jgi:hypothetical protein